MEIVKIEERLNHMQYILDQIRDEMRDSNAETDLLLAIACKIVDVDFRNRVYERCDTPAHVVVLFLKNIISFEALLKVLAERHQYTNFELIKVTENLNGYLPKERKV